MGLLIVAPGPLATIQDLGRPGFREVGVPASGAFDRQSLRIANALLGNPPDCAALELTGFGGVFRARSDLALSVAGAAMTARVERTSGPDLALRVPQTFSLQAGESLIVGSSASGFRLYLAVAGGWDSPMILGSRSTEAPVRAGDVLSASSGLTSRRRPSESLLPEVLQGPFRYLDGPDAPGITSGAWDEQEYRLGALSDRVGLRLEGRPIEVRVAPGRLSSPVTMGSIQVAGGQLIVLGPACGTLGGYPHVGQIISADLDRLGQVRPGDPMRFARVELAFARELDRQRRRAMDRSRLLLEVASRF